MLTSEAGRVSGDTIDTPPVSSVPAETNEAPLQQPSEDLSWRRRNIRTIYSLAFWFGVTFVAAGPLWVNVRPSGHGFTMVIADLLTDAVVTAGIGGAVLLCRKWQRAKLAAKLTRLFIIDTACVVGSTMGWLYFRNFTTARSIGVRIPWFAAALLICVTGVLIVIKRIADRRQRRNVLVPELP